MCVSAIRFSVVILLVLLATMTGGCTQSRVRAVDIFDEVWTIVSEEFHDPNYAEEARECEPRCGKLNQAKSRSSVSRVRTGQQGM